MIFFGNYIKKVVELAVYYEKILSNECKTVEAISAATSFPATKVEEDIRQLTNTRLLNLNLNDGGAINQDFTFSEINQDTNSVKKTIQTTYDEHGNKTVVQTIQIDGLQGDPMPDVFGDLQQHIEKTINKQKEILKNINIGDAKTTYTVKTFEKDDKPLRCSNCGASINNESEACDYCGTNFKRNL